MPNPTGQTIVNNALTRLGILEQGGIPSSSDSQDALNNLNDMWDAWQIDEGLIYGVAFSHLGPIAANTSIITFGAGGMLTSIPTKIISVQWHATVGAGENRKPIRVVDSQTYYGHGDLTASASAPDEIYFDWNINEQNMIAPGTAGQMNAFLYPVPTCPTASYIDFETGSPFTAWTLVGAVYLMPGFQDAIEWALAFRLLSTFGVAVQPQVAQLVQINGKAATDRIRAMNSRNRMVPLPVVEPPTDQITPQQQPAAKG